MASQPVAAAASTMASARSRLPLWFPDSSQITYGGWPGPMTRPAMVRGLIIR